MEAAADLQDTASLPLKFKFNPKLGIDNPALSLAEDSDPWNLERPRFCLLSKEEGTSFGFHLKQRLGKAGHEVCRVEPGTSAYRQGLRQGDQILAVNNNVVEHEDYVVVVRHIRASGPRVLLTVLARNVYDVLRAQRGNDAHLCPALGSEVRPRLCHVVKDEGGFGFSVTHGAQGPFWLVLSAGGAADRAGVPPGARLLEVNGVSVEKFTGHQLSKKLWQSGKQVTLLVAGPEVEEQCRQLGMPLAAPLAEGWALPAKPRCLHLEKGPKGFGFLLREEKDTNGRLRQFLREVDPGLPADKAGMRAGDRLVAVAGESVEALRHEEIVSRIREQGSRVTLTVVDPEADRFFRMVRLSPLLFLESTEVAVSSQASDLTSLVEAENRPVEHKTGSPGPPGPCGSCHCFLYPGPGGGYGFRLSCVTSEPHLFISQVTPGGSAARAGLQMGDTVLEVNGYPVGGDSDPEGLRQLAEAEPPLCLKLAARSQESLKAWIPSGSGEVRKDRQSWEQPKKGKDKPVKRTDWEDWWGVCVQDMETGLWPQICCRAALPSTDLPDLRAVFLSLFRSPRWQEQRDAQRWELEDSEASLMGLPRAPSPPVGSLPAKDVVGGHKKKPEAPGDLWELRRAAYRIEVLPEEGRCGAG